MPPPGLLFPGPQFVRDRAWLLSPRASPTFIPPGEIASVPVGWWKADAIAGLADADPVPSWEDSSPSNNDMTEATNRPAYRTSVQNGLPVVRFDGSNDRLSAAGLTNDDATRTLILAARRVGTSSVWFGFTSGAALSSASGNWGYNVDQATGLPVSFGVSDSTFAISAVRFNSTASADGYVNAGSATNLNPDDGYQSATGASLFLGGDALGNVSNVDIGEALIYNDALSDPDLSAVISYLTTKWIPAPSTVKQLAALGVG